MEVSTKICQFYLIVSHESLNFKRGEINSNGQIDAENISETSKMKSRETLLALSATDMDVLR